MTEIQWTEKTWNPIAGCAVVSPGCTNCYAMKRAWRFKDLPTTPQYKDTVQMTRGGTVWTGKIGIASDSMLTQPLRRKKPTMYFVNSMSDLFHENVPDEVIDRIFAVMALCPQHTFQVLTKRADRMREYLTRKAGGGKRDVQNHIAWNVVGEVMRIAGIKWAHEGIEGKWRSRVIQAGLTWPLPNVWLGVSVEDQTRADERIPHLLETPAAIRFISAEPLLKAVDLTPYLFTYTHDDIAQLECDNCAEPLTFNENPDPSDIAQPRLDWVIVGGESGPNARPMHPDWARSLRDQCVAAGVPFFFKQWGSWAHQSCDPNSDWDWTKAGERSDLKIWHDAGASMRVGKKTAGRLLDGRVWDQMPALQDELIAVMAPELNTTPESLYQPIYDMQIGKKG